MSVLLTMLVIPMPPYSTILQKCEMKNPVYELLANGFIDHGENRDEVQILCDGDAARTIVNHITDVAPQFLPTVRKYGCFRTPGVTRNDNTAVPHSLQYPGAASRELFVVNEK